MQRPRSTPSCFHTVALNPLHKGWVTQILEHSPTLCGIYPPPRASPALFFHRLFFTATIYGAMKALRVGTCT